MPDNIKSAAQTPPELSISPDKVCFIVVEARDFDAKDVVTDPDDSSNATDDAMLSVLEDHKDDPVVQEISAAIFGMPRTSRSISWPWLGSAAATVQSRIGTSCARKPRALTTGAPPPTCSACRYCPIIWRRGWRSSVCLATSETYARQGNFVLVTSVQDVSLGLERGELDPPAAGARV